MSRSIFSFLRSRTALIGFVIACMCVSGVFQAHAQTPTSSQPSIQQLLEMISQLQAQVRELQEMQARTNQNQTPGTAGSDTVYMAYLNGSIQPFITIKSLSKDEAMSNCMGNHTDNSKVQIRCTFNGVEIYSFKPTSAEASGGTPTPTIPSTGSSTVYALYLNGSTQPFVTVRSLSKEEALRNCMGNHTDRPTTQIRCTFNGVEIYSFKPTTDTPNSVIKAPSAPTLTSVTAGYRSAVVRFSASASKGGSQGIEYGVVCTPVPGQSNGGTLSEASPNISINSLSYASSPITVYGLVTGIQYTCAVRARNEVGYSLSSNSSDIFTPVTFSSYTK